MNRSLSDPTSETTSPWVTLPGAFDPDNTAPKITGLLKPLHCDKVVIHGGILNLIYFKNKISLELDLI